MTFKTFSNKAILLCLFYAAAVSIVSDSLNTIALYMAIPFAFVLSYVKCGKIFPNRYVMILFWLYAWDWFSSLWAAYPVSANRELHRVLGAVLLTYIIGVNGANRKMLKYLYAVFIVLYLGAWVYAHDHSLIMSEIAGVQERLNDEKLNANTMAYYTYYVTFALYCLSSLTDSKLLVKSCKYLFLLMIPLSFYVALVTASRQVLVIQVPLIFFLLVERYYRQVGQKKKMLFICFSVLIVLLAAQKVIEIYDSSFLAMRSEKTLTEDSRWFLLMDAIQVGLDHFPFGVGAGNYINYSFNRQFSHCSFTELFSNNGVIGLGIYIYLLYYFIKLQWKRFRWTKDRQFMIFLIFGCIFVFDQIFYVFYTDLWLISFFILVATHSDRYYKEIIIR